MLQFGTQTGFDERGTRKLPFGGSVGANLVGQAISDAGSRLSRGVG